jgi:hypothetical protein
MMQPTTNWGWAAGWSGDEVDFDQNWASALGFSVEFDGDIESFTASGAREGDLEVEGNVGTMLLGFPSYVGSGVTPGMENFSIEVEGDVGYLGATRLVNVEVEIEQNLDDARLSRSSFVELYIGGDTKSFAVSGSLAITADFNGNVGTYRSATSSFNDIYIGGEVNLLVDRGGIMNDYSVDEVDIAQFIGGGFNFLSADEINRSLLVRDSVMSTFYVGETDDRAKIRLERGEGNGVEIDDAGDGTTITTIGGQGNMVRVGEGDVRYNVNLTGWSSDESFAPNITIIGGDGNETFNVNGGKAGGMADVEGGAGRDTFVFNTGTGTAYAHGGDGKDFFDYRGGNAVIEDYTSGQDSLRINSSIPVSLSFYDNGNGTTTVVLTGQVPFESDTLL